MDAQALQTHSYACSFLPYRFNVIPFGEAGLQMQCEFVDSLDDAFYYRAIMLAMGAEDVRVFDTVDGVFY